MPRKQKLAGTPCYNGIHNLEVIYDHQLPSTGYMPRSEVVRWCRVCGGVVVDMEEGYAAEALRPGKVTPMMFPAFVRKGEDKR